MATAVVQSGNYTLELDTGFDFDSFRLDDATKGVLNNTTYTLGPNTTFADITEFVTDIAYFRGRRKTDYQFGAGTMSFTMRDESGILGPYDTTSPYYDPANNEPGLAPMRRVRLKRDTTDLFNGVVTGYDYVFAMAGPNTINVQCADDFYLLAQTQLAAFNPSAETSGERIDTVLDLPEVDFNATARDIDIGTVNLGHDSSYTVDAGVNTLAYLQQINQAEQGRLFMAANGDLTFQPRIGNTLSSPVISFTDDGTAAEYDDLTIAFDADDVINRAYVKALDGKEATDTDTGSIGKYFIQSQSITNSLLHIQGEVDALAAYLLEPEPSPRYTSLQTRFALLTSGQRDSVATIDIGDTISIEKQIPGLNSQIATELAVEGIQGFISVSGGHQITFYTSPTTIVYELILDDAVYGVLDASNVLG
jgi:hypothetical protein